VHKSIDAAARVIETALALALIGAVLLNFVNVVGRYGFGASFFAADELQTYSMVYMAFLGAAVATWRGLHLRMDVLLLRLPGRMQAVLGAIELVLVVVLGGLVTVVAWQYVGQMYALGARSQTAQIPMWIPHAAIAAGFGLMVLVGLLKLSGKR
jgi:TRAP-type C4-dicarboxylate transport system permease small subunit